MRPRTDRGVLLWTISAVLLTISIILAMCVPVRAMELPQLIYDGAIIDGAELENMYYVDCYGESYAVITIKIRYVNSSSSDKIVNLFDACGEKVSLFGLIMHVEVIGVLGDTPVLNNIYLPLIEK